MNITHQELKAILEYDPKEGSFKWLKPNKFHNDLNGKEAGCPQKGQKSYWVIQLSGKKIKRSKLAWFWMTGEYPQKIVDHIDGNSLNDKWENLRLATYFENAWNHRGRVKKSNLPMGVRQSKSGKFVARIGHYNKLITIGSFDTEAEAENAYLIEREKRFGQFA